MSSSKVLESPMGNNCFTSVKHEGEAVGKSVHIGGLDTYVSEPPTDAQAGSKKILLYLSDVYGPFYINSQLIQDYFATCGYTVLGPDYFFGEPVHIASQRPGFDREAWRVDKKKRAPEAFPGWLAAVKEKYGTDAKYCCVGYCFGASFSMNLAASDEVVAAAFAHPALITEDNFKSIKKPLLLCCAEDDGAFQAEFRRRAEDILVENKATYLVQIYSGVSHGFATRADISDENARWAKEECARSVIGWFNRVLTPDHVRKDPERLTKWVIEESNDDRKMN